MAKVTISVFTSPTCPHCPSALNLANEFAKEDNDLKVVEYGANNPHSAKKARELEVVSVPTIFVKGDGYEKNIGFRGTPNKSDFIKAIKIAKGEETFTQEKGLFEKLGEKLGIKIKI